MALFFDQAWFDARLEATGSTREDLARLLRLTPEQIGEVWKDQRELRAEDVAAIARFLNVASGEVALRAGVSTPVPLRDDGPAHRIVQLEMRIALLEKTVEELTLQLKRAGFR